MTSAPIGRARTSSTAQSSIRSPRSLINVGVFTAVYFVIMFSSGMLGIIAPIAILFGSMLAILLNGTVCMLYIAKVPYFGAFSLLALIVGILMVVTGHTWLTIPVALVLGFIADLIARSGTYRKVSTNALAYAIFSLWFLAPISPVFFDSDSYREYLLGSMGQSYADDFMSTITVPVIVIAGILAFLVGLIAAWLGMRILAKHFERAGVV